MTVPMTVPMADWSNFFVAEVGATAALTGLIVVAVSINLTRILSFEQLPARAGESLVILMSALLIASLGLVPGQPAAAFGGETLILSLVALAVALQNLWRSRIPVEGVTRAKIILRAGVNAVVVVPLVIGGALLLFGSPAGLYLIAIGIMAAPAAGVWGAWVLLVEILR
jgi:hypothetical protein